MVDPTEHLGLIQIDQRGLFVVFVVLLLLLRFLLSLVHLWCWPQTLLPRLLLRLLLLLLLLRLLLLLLLLLFG